MALRGGFLHRLLLGAIILATTSASQKDSGCERTCGSVNIPYPFGSSEGCYLDPNFLISCRKNVKIPSTLTPYMGNENVEVLNTGKRFPHKIASSKK
ncbi:Wall-associated receptor kinase-like 9 [Morella rubra]|uniref:Wall-associated receptor kinase-like 9 n=1 Tax=Morella rubra TaxID=262757 RepID=A0A6A1UJC3_9ROSI|nr:Wall-associated receptor kinase-like 9 [Morella rubra]